MSDEEIYKIVHTVLFWTGSGVCFLLGAWTIVEVIVEVAKGKSRVFERDVILAILFHGGMAILALKLAGLAMAKGA